MPSPSVFSRVSARRRRATTAAVLALLGALLAIPTTSAQADPVVGLALNATADGTATFDATAGPGNDTDDHNGEVRSFDSVTYGWAINVNSDNGSTESFDHVTFTQTLPTGLRWQPSSIPAYCKGPGWGIDGQTASPGQVLVCVYVPTGGTGQTGSTLNITLTAQAISEPDGTVATPAPASTSVTVTSSAGTSAPATAAADPVTIRSQPFLDMIKRSPDAVVAPAAGGRPAGYLISYALALQVPPARFSSRGVRGFEMPDVGASFTDDLSGVSPNAEFDSCTGSVTCTPSGSTVDVAFTAYAANAPNPSSGLLASATIKVFVPQTDVDTFGTAGNLNTTNTIANLVASAPAAGGGTIPSVGEVASNNSATYNLITSGTGGGNARFNKQFRNTNGALLPTQAVPNDGNGQVLDGQLVTSQLTIGNASNTAPVPAPAACDVWDNTRIHLSDQGSGPAAHSGSPVWTTSSLVAGVDFVIEYGTQASATGDDATRWAALRSRTDCSDPVPAWSTTAPADLSTVTAVRIRYLHDIPPAGGSAVFVLNLRIADGTTGDLIANFLGTQVGPASTWSTSAYAPATNNGFGSGDRVRVNGITVSLVKQAINPLANPVGSTVTIVSGQGVRYQLSPKVTAVNLGGGAPAPVAHDVVVRDRLPLGLTFDASQPTTPGSITPVVSSDSSGRQILTWTIPAMTQGSEPVLTYWAKSASTTIGSRTNDAIIDSAEDIGGLDDFPAGNTADQHVSHQTVNLQSPGGVQISKVALQSVVEPNDEIAYTLTYANLTPNPIANVTLIDVLPYTGDGTTVGTMPGRIPASVRHGSIPLSGVDVAAGEALTYTDVAPAVVFATTNPSTTSNATFGALPGGSLWCVPADFGTAGCPASMGTVTAFRLQRPSMAVGDVSDVTLRLAPDGDRSADVLSNSASIRYGAGNLGAISNMATTRVVASTIGDLVWRDLNANGIQDAGEPPVAGVGVTLTGTDKHHRAISVHTTTDAAGLYRFTSSSQSGQSAGVLDLVSGTYVVTFDRASLPDGYGFTTRDAAGASAADGSDADPGTGSTASFVLPDPSPSGTDGQDLTHDAGIVPVPNPTKRPTEPEPDRPGSPPVPAPDPKPGKPHVPDTPSPPRPTKPLVIRHSRTITVRAGHRTTITLTMHNPTKRAKRNARMCLTLPAGLTYVSSSAPSKRVDGRRCWSQGVLGAGAERTVRVVVRALPTGRSRRLVYRVRATATGTRPMTTTGGVNVLGDDGSRDRPGRGGGVTG